MKTLQLFVFATLISGNLLSQPAYWMFDWVVKKTPMNDSFDAGILKVQYELDVQAWNTYWCQLYPNATFEGNSTRSYNCHAYAWHVKNGGGNVWINTPDDDKYWGTYGGYTEIGTAAKGENIRISYADDDHSGVGTDEWGIYVSKWGEGPLMSHSAAYCPYTSSNRKYYKIPLSGADNICVSGSAYYTTLNISSGTYDWSGDKVSMSGSSYVGTATGSSYGDGTVTVEIYSPYSLTTVVADFPVFVGTIPAGISMPYYPPCSCYTDYPVTWETFEFNALTDNPSEDPYDYEWEIFGPVYPNGTNTIGKTIEFCVSEEGYYTFKLRHNADCGWSAQTEAEYYFAEGGGMDYIVYPNPATEKINIEQSTENNTKLNEIPTFDMYLFNSNQVLVLSKNSCNSPAQINTSSLKSGVYYLKIITNNKSISKTLVIK